MQYISLTTKDRIGYITLNRPEKRNALNAQLIDELKQAVKLAENDNNAKIIILKAEGKAFCAGADLEYLQSLQTNSYDENLKDSENLMELFRMIYISKKVFIAQVEGHAVAGGAGLATVCDFIFSVPEAKYGYTEVSIGFVPAIVSVFLIRKIGEAKAKDLLLTGKIITASQAKEMNIFNKVINKDEIKKTVFNFAQELINNTSEESLKLTKQLINKVQDTDYNSALKYAAKINAESRATNDCKKGIAAFLNKEKIKW
ncbi:MAG: enoyl-CoA hydratase/isomerase family protein [Bacteroidales bacterium]|nr:enoyl-CoA hydratase/isomerase family protein [Bacteroidales bacterium]